MVARALTSLTYFPGGVALASCFVGGGPRDRTSARNRYRPLALDFCET